MPRIAWGSFIAGALIGILLYHFSKNRVAARAA
jgi:hypothetical protein